jgi:hypothetical protein
MSSRWSVSPLAAALLLALAAAHPALAQGDAVPAPGSLPPPVPRAEPPREPPGLGERAGAALDRAVTVTGEAVGRAAEAVGTTAGRAAEAAAGAVGRAARATGGTLERAGEWLQRQGDRLEPEHRRQP